MSTGTVYAYKNVDTVDLSSSTMVFTVMACNDAHLALCIGTDADTDADPDSGCYEIVLGGWGNMKSAIR